MRGAHLERGKAAELTEPLRHREFRLLWVAQLLSEAGDWAARVALGVLVLERTGSVRLATLATAATLLPWVGIGQALAALGDRYDRRKVVVASDIIRAVTYGAMAFVDPAWLLLSLAFIAGLSDPPFEAARSALLVESIPEERYGAALSLANVTYQVAVLAGALSGGGLLAVFGAEGALLANAATFLISALVLLRLRPRARPTDERAGSVRDAARVLLQDPWVRRSVILFAVISACGVAIEALIPVYVLIVLDADKGLTGLVTAAVPIGTGVALLFMPGRGDNVRLLRIACVVAVSAAAASAVVFGLDPPLLIVLVGFALVGVMFASAVPANVVYGRRLPDRSRAAAFGLVNGVVMAAGSTAAIGSGLLAASIGTRPTVLTALALAGGFALLSLARLGSVRGEQDQPAELTTPTRR